MRDNNQYVTSGPFGTGPTSVLNILDQKLNEC